MMSVLYFCRLFFITLMSVTYCNVIDVFQLFIIVFMSPE